MTGRITLTGADDNTPLAGLVDLCAMSPRVEIGLLLSFNNMGTPRYPSVATLVSVVGMLGKRCSVHICGEKARRFFMDNASPVLAQAGRVQVNGRVGLATVREFSGRYGSVITQWTEEGPDLRSEAVLGHELLIDASGGRGIVREVWPSIETHKPTGFAGGLTPETLPRELPRIHAVADIGWWIDIEGGLRGFAEDGEAGEFSLSRAARSVDVFLHFLRKVGYSDVPE